MDYDEFKTKMAMAQTFARLENQQYWNAYQRGLRRKYHGENFGTIEEHKQWMSIDDNRGVGYRDGFNAKPLNIKETP